MHKPRIAVISFPGNNCEVESMRSVERAGMHPVFFRWNDDRAKLQDIDGYFLVGGFAYEDRGRSGMVAGRDPLLGFIASEAEKGKVVIGNCNGAQILVESGLIPLQNGLRMSLARNAIKVGDAFRSPGFLSEWVWIKPTYGKDRCATSNWDGVMHLPIAHGEGRFTTDDSDLIEELRRNEQLAFSYCDEQGDISDDPVVTPNGSAYAVAGICNPAGNVIALMPHPERTPGGDPYFSSIRDWIVGKKGKAVAGSSTAASSPWESGLAKRDPKPLEIFIDTIIVNNEERTVEQALRRVVPSATLKQWKYVSVSPESLKNVLSDLTVFNPRKERAFIRTGGRLMRWNAEAKSQEALAAEQSRLFEAVLLLRRDIPDTGAGVWGAESQTGICYGCSSMNDADLRNPAALEILANPHASILERLA